ncbi:MAG: Vitamin B12 transporter BtuB [Steroidobacteraceae bacterium]|nr:Vitamin B12 transporter BtuB [Steroidobacteraceae bacterium]
MKPFVRVCIAMSSILGAATALAQEAAQNAVTLDEIVVTARRAEENLQKVPLSITAIGESDIQAMGLSRVEDIAAMTPGFSFRQGFGRGFERPVIRGMSNIQGAANAAFFIDGVFVNGAITGYNLDNVERIEVIRGPQSALFGRSTFAGAINYVTRKPTDDYEGSVKVSAGEFNYQDMSAWLSGPIIDGQLRFQLNGRYYNKDGQYTNLVSGTKDIGGQRTKSVGAVLDWTPTGWFDATLRANYSVDADGLAQLVRLGGPGTGLTAADVRNCYPPLPGTRRRGYFCGVVPVFDFLSANTTNYRDAGLQPGRQVNTFRSSLVMSATWRDYVFTSTTSLDRISNYGAADQDYSSLRGFGGAFESVGFSNTDYWSQELRAASPRTGRLRWQAGLYTYEVNPDKTAWSGSLVANPMAGLPDLPAVITPQAVDSSTKNEAVFAMLEFDLLDDLTLTAEGRYAEDKIHTGGRSRFSKSSNSGFVPGSYSSGCTVASTPIAGSPNRQTLTCSNAYVNDSSFKNFLPRLTATWLVSDTMTLYAQYAKGNKPGGFNADAENARTVPADRSALATLGLLSFDEEEADSYEVGFKSRLFDRRVQFNTALYFIDWTNQQLTQTSPVREEGTPVGAPATPQFTTSYTSNLGKSEIRGLEIEMLAALNRNWDLRMTYALQDAEIKEYLSSDQSDLVFAGPYTGCIAGSQCYADYLAAGDLRGNKLPRVPKHLASASLAAHYPIGNWGTFNWRADYSYEASRYAQVHNLAETGDSNVVNMRVGIERDAWTATLWVNNLTDDKTAIDIMRTVDPALFIIVPVQPPLPGTVSATNARDFAVTLPDRRMYGLTLTYRFR